MSIQKWPTSPSNGAENGHGVGKLEGKHTPQPNWLDSIGEPDDCLYVGSFSAALAIGISVRSLERYRRSGELRGLRLGQRTYVYRLTDVASVVSQRRWPLIMRKYLIAPKGQRREFRNVLRIVIQALLKDAADCKAHLRFNARIEHSRKRMRRIVKAFVVKET